MNTRYYYSVLAVLILSFSPKAHALDFAFSMQGVGGAGHGIVGTVTGEIRGLADNGTSIPSEIYLTSSPLGLLVTTSISSPSYLSNTGWNLGASGSFSVTSGMIDSSTSYTATRFGGAVLTFNGNSGVNVIGIPDDAVGNDWGFAGVTYTPLSAPVVPEPGTYALMLVSILAMFFGWRRFAVQA